VSDASGARRRDLTPGTPQSLDGCPSWSPDGRQVVFFSKGLDGGGLYVVNIDGTGRHELTSDIRAGCPEWSPGGASIAVGDGQVTTRGARFNAGFGQVYVIGSDGTEMSQLTHAMGYITAAGAPAWSPDGTKIAYRVLAQDVSRSTGYVMNADGSGRTRIAGNFDDPAWSPDGSTIAFCRRLKDRFALFVIHADGTGAHRLISNTFPSPISPTWSPDGRTLVFASTSWHSGDLYVVNADGTSLARLIPGGVASDPDWNPAVR